MRNRKKLEVKPKEKDILPVKTNKRDTKFAGKVQDNTAKEPGFTPLDSASNQRQSKGYALPSSLGILTLYRTSLAQG